MTAIPLMVDLKGKKVIIVGGGKLAERRIHTLLESEASIHVISPDILPNIYSLYKEGQVEWAQKEFSPSDLDQADLIIAATNDSQTNQAIINHAPAQALINSVENASKGNIQFPNHLKRGKLSISISTNGASPMLTSSIKKQLEEHFDDRYETYVDFLFEARQLIKQSPLSDDEKRKVLKQLVTDDWFDSDLQEQMLARLRELNDF